MNVVDIGGPGWRTLAHEMTLAYRASDLVLLLGSGVSQFAPSSVPTGRVVSARLRRELLAELPAGQRSQIDYLTREMPFEVLMARLGELDAELARDLVCGLVDLTTPNVLHRQVAELLVRAREIRAYLSVLTTNYDIGIGLALKERLIGATARMPDLVVREGDVRSQDRRTSLFHVHGSASDPTTLVLDYPTEFQLDPWKRKLLVQNTQGKTLLVLGFSAQDLDVAEALADARPRRLIWARATQADCDVHEWPWAAQRLVASVGSQRTTSLAVEHRLDLVLEPLTSKASVAPQVDESAIEERFRRAIAALGRPRLGLWARWMAVRAGFWSLGLELSESERRLLRVSQDLDVRAFAHFFAGRYLTAAALERAAANRSRSEGGADHGYLYHRNNEAEFYNRGARSLLALSTIIQGAWFALRHRNATTADARKALGREIRNLLGSAGLLWPLPVVLIAQLPLLRVPARAAVTLLQALNRSGDWEKFALLEFFSGPQTSSSLMRAEARFSWLGQKQRLINLYRVSVLQELIKPGKNSIEKLEAAFRRAYFAAQWSVLVNDPVRLGRSWLVLLEVSEKLRTLDRERYESLEQRVETEFGEDLAASEHKDDVAAVSGGRRLHPEPHLSDAPSDAADRAWASLRRSQTSRVSVNVARALYQHGVRCGLERGRNWRLLGLVFLETS